MGGLVENLCLETDLLVCFAGRVDAGVLSAPRGRCKQSAALFSTTQLQMGWLVAVIMQAVVAMAFDF